jgi:hypothetical protein
LAVAASGIFRGEVKVDEESICLFFVKPVVVGSSFDNIFLLKVSISELVFERENWLS